ncbi:hypothetical protein [Chryseobacterium sp. MMS23-Vi53]|uniref:hypothetical protein n=1 Tax=Chryseobacterium sp. MMS23-Vi53 TaxID=3386644 RepID=UPI0039E7908E
MKKYYDDTKSIILTHEKELGEENLNMMLNFNKNEYRKAVKDNVWRDNLSKQDKETAKTIYATNLSSKLDSYKVIVLEKLDDLLKK